MAHLRKHGIDPNSLDLDAIVLQSNEREIPEPAHFASPDVENKSHHIIESRSVSPSFLGDSRCRCYALSYVLIIRKVLGTTSWAMAVRQATSWTTTGGRMIIRLTIDGLTGPPQTMPCSWARRLMRP